MTSFHDFHALKRTKFQSLFLLLLMVSTATYAAADNWEVEGEHGELHVTGKLTEAACRLDMTSSLQQIDIGEITAAKLQHVGDQSEPEPMRLRFVDCVRSSSGAQSHRSGNLVWSGTQPVVSISFLAPVDVDNTELVKIEGDITGVGLRLIDELHRKIRIGERGRPRLLEPGQNELLFYVSPERTNAPLKPGPWSASVNFRLNYE